MVYLKLAVFDYTNLPIKTYVTTILLFVNMPYGKGSLMLFGPNNPDLGIWAHNFQKPMSNLKSSSSK